jgi:hypothetical protein
MGSELGGLNGQTNVGTWRHRAWNIRLGLRQPVGSNGSGRIGQMGLRHRSNVVKLRSTETRNRQEPRLNQARCLLPTFACYGRTLRTLSACAPLPFRCVFEQLRQAAVAWARDHYRFMDMPTTPAGCHLWTRHSWSLGLQFWFWLNMYTYSTTTPPALRTTCTHTPRPLISAR